MGLVRETVLFSHLILATYYNYPVPCKEYCTSHGHFSPYTEPSGRQAASQERQQALSSSNTRSHSDALELDAQL